MLYGVLSIVRSVTSVVSCMLGCSMWVCELQGVMQHGSSCGAAGCDVGCGAVSVMQIVVQTVIQVVVQTVIWVLVQIVSVMQVLGADCNSMWCC